MISPLLKYVVRNLTVRPFVGFLVLASMATVTGVIAAILSARGGLERALHPPVNNNWALVTSPHANAEWNSALPATDLATIVTRPEVVRYSPESITLTQIVHEDRIDMVILRAVEPLGFDMHGIKISEGRLPTPGEMEFVIGAAMQSHFNWLKVGSTITTMNMTLTCVGIFQAEGFYGGEMWMPRATIRLDPARNPLSSITVETKSPADVAAYIAGVNGLKSVDVQARTEAEFGDALVGEFRNLFFAFNVVFAFILAGSLLTAACVIAVLQQRGLPELCVMRAMGFRGFAISRLLVLESELIMMAGAALGLLTAFLLLSNLVVHASSTSFSIINYKAAMTWQTAGTTLGLMLIVGVVGAMLPIVRMRRTPITNGLREE
jgi:ABC-type lipoprotein release transport system permease subunit